MAVDQLKLLFKTYKSKVLLGIICKCEILYIKISHAISDGQIKSLNSVEWEKKPKKAIAGFRFGG